MISILILALTNPYAGSYSGTYRAGFLNPRPITVDIAANGWTVTGPVLRTGWTRSDGTFTWNGPAVWDGSFEWRGNELVGVFTQTGGNTPVSGGMWLD